MPITTKAVSSNPVHGERGVLDTTLCDSVCQCRWFCPGIPVSLINKTDRHDINDILLKVTLNTINQLLLLIKIEVNIQKENNEIS